MEKEVKEKSVQGEGRIRSELLCLYELQKVDSDLDGITRLRGELPQAVSDLEDEIEGLKTRQGRVREEIGLNQEKISQMRIGIKNAEALRERYQEQQQHVRNNREYEALNSEIEYQSLEIEHFGKKIKATQQTIAKDTERIDTLKATIAERKDDLEAKRAELESITEDTEQKEKALLERREELKGRLPVRVLRAYERIRGKAYNGLAVVGVVRGACGGCFNKVPPQRQLEIRLSDQFLMCEYCGRVLVDMESLEKELNPSAEEVQA